MGHCNRHICYSQMGGRDLLEIGVGVHPAVEAQVGEFCEQIAGGCDGVFHPIDVNGPGCSQHSNCAAQGIGGEEFQRVLQQSPRNTRLLEGKALQAVPGLEVKSHPGGQSRGSLEIFHSDPAAGSI